MSPGRMLLSATLNVCDAAVTDAGGGESKSRAEVRAVDDDGDDAAAAAAAAAAAVSTAAASRCSVVHAHNVTNDTDTQY
jgi:hypothetical protein